MAVLGAQRSLLGHPATPDEAAPVEPQRDRDRLFLRAERARTPVMASPSRFAPGEFHCRVLHRTGLPHYRDDSETLGEIEMTASVLSFRAAVLMVVAGMIWGIAMGSPKITQCCQPMPT